MDKTKQKLKQARQPDDVSQKEELEALDVLGNWLTKKLKGKTDSGPFSEANLGDIPVKVIAKRKMGHIIRDWYAQGCPNKMLTGDMNYREQVEMDIARQYEAEANMRELGYDIARKALDGNPKMLAYVEAVYETNDYRAVAKKLKMTLKEVQELESQLLALLEQC